MRTIVFLCFASVATANPFTSIWNFVMGKKPVEPVIECVIQVYDPAFGPMVEKKHWNTPCVLAADITFRQMMNVKDPAEFLNARFAASSPPTAAVWIDNLSGRITAVNQHDMSNSVQALEVRVRLDKLSNAWYGTGCGEAREVTPSNPFSRIDYKGDPRRHYYVGTINVGRVRATFANAPVEAAERAIIAEIERGACE
jgi:hypothetical protein